MNLVPGGGNQRGNYYLSAFARLRPGVTLEQARAQVNAFDARLEEKFPSEEPEQYARRTNILSL